MKKKNLLMTAIAIFGLATTTFAQVPNYVPTNGLVGWWPFHGNANDESGNGHHGIVNGAVLDVDENNVANEAYYFDGNDRITIPHNSDFNVQSLSILITYRDLYNPAAQPNGNSMLLSKREPSGWGSSFEFNQGGASWDFAASNSISGNITYGFGAPQVYGQWRTVIYTHDANSIKVYFDGMLIDSIGSPGVYNSNSLDITVGMRGNGWHELIGSISKLGIWNRALTGQEITHLYNECQLSVNTQPANQTININNNAQFLVSSTDPNATYQWQTDLGVGYQNLNSVGQYSGTTNDTLTVSNVTMSNNNQPFRCIVSSGSCSDTSNVAVLTVNNNVGIIETSQDKLFSVFPNPTQSVINVKADGKLIGSVYSIYDNTGRVVLTGKVNSENTTIELGNLSGGIYMFNVGENMKQTFKVIKE